MIYHYQCKFCNEPVIVVKSHHRLEMDELCPFHGSEMKRDTVNRPSLAKASTFKEGFQPAFGKHFTNARQQKEHIKMVEDKTGKEIIEVGNEVPRMKAPKHKIDMENATKELRHLWRK